MAFYPAIPASDGTSMAPPQNALFEVFELSDATFSTPLPLLTSAGTDGAPLVTTAQGVVPPVNVVSPNMSHIFKSGEWEWRRDSFDAAEIATQEARDAAGSAAADAARSRLAAEAAAESAQAPADEALDAALERADLPGVIAEAVTGKLDKSEAASTFAAKPDNGGKPVGKGELVINVCDYGAKGDWVSGTGKGTDNLPAFIRAMDVLRASGGGTLYIPGGKYRFSGEWNIWRSVSPRCDVAIVGEDQLTTFLVADFYGADRALVKCVDPTGAVRSSPTSMRNLSFATVSRSGGVNPVFIDILGWSESNIKGLRFSSNNNTHFRLGSSLGVRLEDIVSLYGGYTFHYKKTQGTLFTLAADGVVTASVDTFTSTDVGKFFFFNHASIDESRGRYVIESVLDARTAKIDATKTTIYPGPASPGHFEPARLTINAGQKNATANADCFTPQDTGRVVYIRNATNGSFGQGILRATITNVVNSRTVSLSVAPDRSVAEAYFGQPVLDFWSDSKTEAAAAPRNTFMTVDGLRVEAFAGIAVGLLGGVEIQWDNLLLHGMSSPEGDRYSNAMLWCQRVGGYISMNLDGGNIGDFRAVFSDFGDTLKLPYLSSRRVRNEKLIKMDATTGNAASLSIEHFTVYRHEDLGVGEVLQDNSLAATGTRKIFLNGTVAMVGGTSELRRYLGMDMYATAAGDLVKMSPDKSQWRIVVSNTGALSAVKIV